ncbi:MAG: exonuclease SbcCD subunit D [Clostridia bacterium]|nr:exonuclease SbcCD subunit D [Clostridia bacterium]
MKLLHLSDFHLGKRVNEYSMLEDQEYILKRIVNVIDDEKPDAVLIAGDIYDKAVPPTEAVELFDNFLVELAKRRLQAFIISGNHDSPERLSFGNRLIDASGIHLSPVYSGSITPFCLHDSYGEVDIFMLPFVKPAHVRRFFPHDDIQTYTDAVRTAVTHMPLNSANRKVLVTHQFITGAVRSESEDISVGGSDNIDVSVFDDFDYVALGHLHGPQNIASERVRYCGSPLKYSFSEAAHNKSVTVVELAEKGSFNVRTVPLVPLHDMVEIRGTYSELTLKKFYESTTYRSDYVHITLTDEEDIPNAIGNLRVIYRNLMKLDYDNKRTRYNVEITAANAVESKSPLELFAEFYELQNNTPLSEEQAAIVQEMIEKIWEDER